MVFCHHYKFVLSIVFQKKEKGEEKSKSRIKLVGNGSDEVVVYKDTHKKIRTTLS